ncbi:PLD nuclease N-terminal domain-containing protein [Populibacterium corticicola]|uniref:PLD nuclease N-terminal domain-containing protein n=1 Tax=Populibacterium corticicola TaxID=1812826 RepID=A0ABW5XE55_9MICO
MLNVNLEDVFAGDLGIFLFIIPIVCFLLMVAALVSIAKAPITVPNARLLWFLIVLVANFIGAILWFVWGHSHPNDLAPQQHQPRND